MAQDEQGARRMATDDRAERDGETNNRGNERERPRQHATAAVGQASTRTYRGVTGSGRYVRKCRIRALEKNERPACMDKTKRDSETNELAGRNDAG